MAAKVDYRLLAKEDWDLAKPLLAKYGAGLPNAGFISCAFDGSTVTAVSILQPALHCEPMVIAGDKVNFYALQRPWKDALPKGTQYWVFAPDGKIARLAEGNGMEQVPWSIWKGST